MDEDNKTWETKKGRERKSRKEEHKEVEITARKETRM
jgi:hypothetical protein